MKNKYIYISLFVCLISCDNRFDFIEGLNHSPKLVVVNHEESSVFVDSIKISKSLKAPISPYSLPLNISDIDNNLSSINIILNNSEGVFTIDGVEVVNNNIEKTVSGTFNFGFIPAKEDESYVILLNAVDNIGATSLLTLNLITFNNLLPIPKFKVTIPSSQQPFNAILDASGSIDGDNRFGGAITGYEFKIDEGDKEMVITKGTRSTIPWVFPGSGVYMVTVNVFDNDNESKSISVNLSL